MSHSIVQEVDQTSHPNIEMANENFNFEGGISEGVATTDSEVNHQTASNELVPKVGMTFSSEDDAYNFYNAYAKKIGFSIKKCHSKYRVDGTLSSKYFLCSNEGHKNTSQSNPPKKERASTRSCCNARVQFFISRQGVWTVQKVVLAHNHVLASPDKIYMLRSQRRMSIADEHIISKMREAGVKPAEIYDFFQRWSGGAENVQFLKMDCSNFISRERNKYLEPDDAQILLEYLKNKQVEDPSFFYAVQIDKETREICNFFWADGQAIADYTCFGDVICFDTTFQTNKSEMPFAPILGTNHHKQTVLFGAALLFNESTQSFVWLFETFLKAMSGKQPETIFTNQCAAMENAIKIMLPNSSHRLCLWHIYQNTAKHLSHVIANNRDFLKEFKSCIYKERSVAHFNMKWQDLVTTYNLQNNSWMENLYALCEKWATVYRHDTFCADMTSTQRSEGMNNVFKKTFCRKLSISELLVQYDKCAARLRANELLEDFRSRNSEPVLYVKNLPLLRTAAKSYTRNLYSIFEEEFKNQFVLSCTLQSRDGTISTYKIMSIDGSEDEATVIFSSDDMQVLCSCKKYDSFGMLCKHVLRVFNHNDIITLPPKYISSRWTKYAKRKKISCDKYKSDSLSSKSALLSQKIISVALKCAVSKEALKLLEDGFDKLTLEVDNLLSKVNLNVNETPQYFLECTKEVAETRISFRVPPQKRGPTLKRKKNVLEGGKRNATKNTRKKEGPNASNNFSVRTLQPSEQFNSNAVNSVASVMTNNIMLFGDNALMFAPPVRGEFTNLLLQAEEVPACRRLLNFDE